MVSTKCALIGQGPILIACAERLQKKPYGIRGVISDCEQVRAWCEQSGVPLIKTTDDQLQFLKGEPIEFLFSIVNHKVLAPELLSLPTRAAINYHDSPLPDYAGFNATAWAILDDKKSHGITWHRMTENVDEGNILVSESIDILEDDTAFTLSTKCGDAALRGFDALLERLDRDDLSGNPQGPNTNFHLKSARPGVGLLNFDSPARNVARQVHGLDFGPDESWLTTAKFRTPTGAFLRAGSATVSGDTGKPPGTVAHIAGDRIQVATQEGSVELTELTSLDGQALSASALSEAGVVVGSVLASPDQAESAPLEEFDAKITRTERFWKARLEAFQQTALSDINSHEKSPSKSELSQAAPAWLASLPSEKREAALLAAVGLYLSRAGEGTEDVRLAYHSGKLSDAERAIYSDLTPLQIRVNRKSSWSDLLEAAAAELAEHEKRQTFARDVRIRYPSLRELGTLESRAAIAITRNGSALPSGISLSFGLDDAGSQIKVAFDSEAVSQETAQVLAARVARILEQGADSPGEISLISTLTQDEGKLLLETWQDTKADYASDKCVHQLFEEQVQRTPDDTALVFQSETLTYAELDRRANAVAKKLIDQGVKPDELVGVCVKRSLNMMVALMGVLKAGAAYVPLDPAYPVERISIMLEDSKARVLITSSDVESKLPKHGAEVLLIEKVETFDGALPSVDVKPNHLAYVIFTSGSTGRPKGVMVEHGNVSNFFTGMDATVGGERGTWLAVTSISFDISVLELFWTLARGFKVVIQEEGDRASRRSKSSVQASSKPMKFGMFYFAAQQGGKESAGMYRLLMEGAKFADKNDFAAVWTPERHFHEFGGIYPNPAVTTAALAAVTENVPLRAGSVVLPLHNPIRVAEDWAVVDNLSNGRVGLSFASGWHANDFALMPDNFEDRRNLMQEQIATVRKLWKGEKIAVKNGKGQEIEVGCYPRPIQENPPIWIATAGTPDTFRLAGEKGFNILTNMLGQDIEKLRENFAAYRAAWKDAGHEGEGNISVMLHTFICGDDDEAKELARGPFCNYMASSYDLTKVAPWMFPAFKQPSSKKDGSAFDAASFDDDDKAALLEHAFERYYETAGLFGTPERALKMVEQLKEVGCDEIACLIDFGVDPQTVIDNFNYLNELRVISNPADAPAEAEIVSVGDQIKRHEVTHLQCTPSMARLLIAEGALPAMAGLKKLLLGGEALPLDLVGQLKAEFKGELWNMYGPTEATIWSTTSLVESSDQPVTIGSPIANTVIRILGSDGRLAPIGEPGELCIGGAGVVRGYFGQPEMTKERFIADPYADGQIIYRTGDLARYRADGQLDFMGRLDQQVKLNGYRIEMGEIETILSKHPSVRDSVVVAREDGAQAQLVAYMVTGQDTDAESDKADAGSHVASWEKMWSGAYQQGVGADKSDPRFNTSGWLSSFTGEPVPQDEMRHWANTTVNRMVALKPENVLEIGCGTGMLLYGALPHVSTYTGVDVSDQALEGIRAELSSDEKQKVNLFNCPAHELDKLNIDKVDLVVINSVAQYFPSGEYLESVLKSAASVVKEGGHIFLGDLRSLEQLRAFHAIVELHQAPGQRSAASLRDKIAERQKLESELLVSQDFFTDINSRLPGLNVESIQLKRGTDSTEMTLLRYDVVLTVGATAPPLALPAAMTDITQASDLASALSDGPTLLLAEGLKNARLAPVLQAMTDIDAGKGQAEDLRKLLDEDAGGIAPESLYTLSDKYDVEMRWGGNEGAFDVLFRAKNGAPQGNWPLNSHGATATTNVPASADSGESVIPSVRKHLRDFLPEYMVPTAYVTLSTLPLTPNGKIDRKSLPAPGKAKTKTAQAYVTPQNDLEKTIAEIWQEMLGVERVGTKDNIFDLGASSLLTVEANSRLSSALEKKIPLVNMFRYPTIESLAKHLGADLAPKQEEPSGAKDRKQAAIERRRAARARAST